MSQTREASAGASVPARIRTRAVLAGTLGNVLEWYDFSVYGFLVPSIAAAFFPKASHLAQILFAFGVFGIGFFMRPVGSLVIGAYGDRAGRRAALTLTVALMGVSTLVIGLLPTYATAGALAPVLLTLARLAQGFSAGGEWGGAAAFLVEYAPEGRRGYIGSWQQFSVGGGLLLGSGFATLLAKVLGQDALAAWAWRIPFLCGIVIAGFSAYFRFRLKDTPQFEAVEKLHAVSAHPLRDLLTEHRPALLTQFGITIHNTASYYITLTYMPTWLASVIKMPQAQALEISTIGLVVLVCATPLIGALSDRIGRKPLLIMSCLGFIVFCYPLYRAASTSAFAVVLAVQIVLVLLTATYSACVPATYSELFPTRVRYSGLSVGYNLAVMVFGGFAPFIATWLISLTGSSLAPTFYVIGCAVVTLFFVLRMRETAFTPLHT
jgi:MHS family proline/betaine transporter-like MFS transporter